MDAKYLAEAPSLTGSKLLWALASGLTFSALGLDVAAGRLPTSPTSLFFPLVSCALLSGIAGYWVIPILRNLKAGQYIREDGPKAHLKKAGTPTMGGIFIVPVAVLYSLLATGFAPAATAAAGLTLAFGLVGWLDDWQILRYRSNKGISPRLKLLLQLGFGILFCLWLAFGSDLGWEAVTSVSLPFNILLPLGLLFWPLALFVMMAESNATNLTDGVDGLAAGTGAIALLGLGAFLGLPNSAGAVQFPELMTFAAATAGSYLGFLIHNRNPARVFMGDTGSLALGGALAAIALIGNLLWVLLLLGGLFLAESLSVIAQVGYYKATKGPDGIGKRLFKMAPLHHHLELSGWPETQVVATFYGVGLLLAVLCYFIH
ncbi:MAG: phospho-N-acetylmuramoyl-pentapeptide-transferase [Synechococcales cyanobacterium RM1_1_8]|nr:phospho-N-acetylmuramoyl-pentapeptide-transferase [Synechococcales cyanobacterium RM1_1_8]